MGLLEKVFGNRQEKKVIDNITSYLKTFNAYTPAFTSFDGGLYELELTRAVVHAVANQCGKLKPEISGDVYKGLEKKLQFKPNPYMDTFKFNYRVATILETQNTAFIVPIYGSDYETIVGYYPILPQRTEIVEKDGTAYLKYTFTNGQRAAIELDKVGILTKHQYRDDFFGESNRTLQPTLNLINLQKQGIEEGIKQGAMIRFIARLTGTHRPDDIAKERTRFKEENLGMDNNNGVIVFDNKYADIKQVTNQSYIVDAEQMKIIQNNVYNYFGVNEAILQNKYNEDEWNAFYESKIEPFALQLSLVMSNMTFTEKEREQGSQIVFTSNRLQYASNKTKLEVAKTMVDRGIMSRNEIRDIWNLAHIEDGDKHYIRKDYAEIGKLEEGEEDNANKDN